MYYLKNELYHHGILGQKWGVRRYQNTDGSLTTAGKQRYRNGRAISKEHGKIVRERYDKAVSKSQQYKNLTDERDSIVDRYDLNNYYDHENDTGLQKFQREWYEAKRKSIQESIDSMDKEFMSKARQYADKKIIEKYGDVGLEDMKYYQGANATIAVTALLGILGGVSIYSATATKREHRSMDKQLKRDVFR